MPLIVLVDMNRRSGAGTSIRKSRGLDLASRLEAKFGVRSRNKRKNMGRSGTTRGKKWDIFRVISEIQKAKFGVLFACTFGDKIWG